MKGCTKVKKPCKVCFQTVTNKNGLQCQGACKKWAHYKCLNYTPGKIQDIKKGVIKVMCPCPDCSTTEPKEVLTNPPFSCTNQQCPANKLPKCESAVCPSNRPIPPLPVPEPSPQPPRCPHIPKCCPTSRPGSGATKPCPSPPRRKSPRPPIPPPAPPCRKAQSDSYLSSSDSGSPSPGCADEDKPKPGPRCPGCGAATHPTPPARKCPKEKAQNPGDRGKGCTSSSESNVSEGNVLLISALGEMCDTVGELSTQLRQLMCKMMQSTEN